MSVNNKRKEMTPIRIPPEIQKKIDLYMEYFREQTKDTFNFMENYFRTQTALPPIIFKIVVGSEVIQRVLDQKMIVLEIASQMGPNGTIDDLMPLIEEREKKYFRLDSYLHNFRRRHKNYPKARDIIKKWFVFRVKADGKNLIGVGNSWFDILRSVHTKESGTAVINEEIGIVEELMSLIRENRGIINVPGIVRVDVLNAMLAMGEKIKENLFKQIDLAWPDK
ncbi:MAG: hypothetical protein ACTSO9_13685 [Candidatus Helarchaeota archaeon]